MKPLNSTLAMSFKVVALWSALSPVLTLPGGDPAPPPAPAQLHLTLATLHAAALTAPRAVGDTVDGPYILVSISGPGNHTSTVHLPATGHLSIHLDEALGSRPLIDLSLQPGDSVRLLLSVLEDPQVELQDETAAATASTRVLSQTPVPKAPLLEPALAPIIKEGAHWLGSAELLLTNEAGSIYWRALACVATCNVLKAPAGTALAPAGEGAVAGVVELSGNGGTYHLQVQGQRAS